VSGIGQSESDEQHCSVPHSEKDHACEMENVPEYVAVSPIILDCPRCKAEPNEACDMLDDVVALIHLDRIEADITLNQAKRAN
jgi:hypothetical protein